MKYKFSRTLCCLMAAVLICGLIGRPVHATGADAPPAGENGQESQEDQQPEAPAGGGYVTAQNWPEPPEIGADGVILMDAVNGTVLYAKNADQTFYPASITKILTALLVIENCSLDETVTYSKEAIYSLISGAAAIGIVPGEEMSVEDSLYALLLHSANDAANGLAEHVAGSMSAFADLKMCIRDSLRPEQYMALTALSYISRETRDFACLRWYTWVKKDWSEKSSA